MNRYIAFDCETGGIGIDMSLLTVHFKIYDDQFNCLGFLDLKVKPNNSKYVINAEAMAINKIDLIAHDKLAMPYGKAGQVLRDFLILHSEDKKIKLIPIGKNIEFDINHVTEHLLGRSTWNNYVSYRLLEVTSIALACQIQGKLREGSISLGALIDHFSISVDGKQHEAEYDIVATVEVLKRLLAL